MIGSAHRFTIGDFVCISFCDADQLRQGETLFPNAPKGELNKAFSDLGYQTDALKFSMNLLYIRTPEHSILVDTGLGGDKGKLPETLVTAGIELNKIDMIIITHGHGDHIGGIIGADGSPTYPKARYAMWKSEWEHWIEAATQAENPNESARKNLLPIKDKVTLIDSEREIVPGVCAVHAPGHTMGHMAVLVESKGEKLLHTVDAVHHPVQLPHPDWAPGFDVNPIVSTETRKKLFEQAANEKILMMAYHFQFPGLGHVERSGDAFKWEPVVLRSGS